MQTKEKSAAEFALEIESLLAENAALREQLQLLSEQVAYLNKDVFGRKSERWTQAGQLDFFRKGAAAAECAALEVAPVVKTKSKKKKGAHGRGSLPAHLERITHVIDLPEDAKCCSVCEALLQDMGEEITERATLIPAHIVVNRYVRKKAGCPHGHEVRTADLPDGVIAGSKYDASVLAHVAVAKYNDHLPLNRLEGICKRQGIKLSRQTMWEMMLRVDELVAQPILKQMRKELLEEPILHADESPVNVRIEGKKGTKQGWVWNWRNEPDYDSRQPSLDYKGRRSKALVEFHLGRGGKIPSTFLADWFGSLVCDGHQDYSPVTIENGITRAGCWAHVRRPFRLVVTDHPKWAALPFFLINRLFALERAIAGRAKREEMSQKEFLELRRLVRARSAGRLVDRIVELADELKCEPRIMPKSKLGKGVRYILNQQQSLRAFLDDARLPIHNNDSERDLRHVVTGRKAWMFFASERGGDVACRIFSLMLSCKQNSVNPEAYLADVLMAVAITPSSKIASLTPWAWREAKAQVE